MSEKLTLRGTNSPFIGVYQDINKGSVLSHSELDENFILLKGHVIYDINVDNQTIIFKKLNGNDLSFDIDVDTTQLTGGTYDSITGTATFTDNTGGTFDVVGFFKESDDIYTSGFTFNPANYDLTIFRNDGNSFGQSAWNNIEYIGSGGDCQFFKNTIQELIHYPSNQINNRIEIESNINSYYSILVQHNIFY